MFRKDSLVYKFLERFVYAIKFIVELLIRLASDNKTFYDSRQFPWTAELEANWRSIRGELEEVRQRSDTIPEFKTISEKQERITRGNTWRTFFFYAYGQRADDNCMRCPETARLVEQIPGMTTAMFSIFAPGTYLTPHRGPFKGVLRYHLGVRIPRDMDASGIRVGDQTRSWHEGESLIFDDTHEHEAWNRSQEDRVVLFVDFIRPLPFPLSVINRWMILLIASSPFIQDLVTQLNAWNRRVADVQFSLPASIDGPWTFRPAEINDVPAIYRLQDCSFREMAFVTALPAYEVFHAEALRKLQDPLKPFWVLERGRTVDGFAEFTCFDSRYWVTIWGKWLHSLVYAAMVAAFEKINLSVLTWHVRRSNRRMMRICSANGFRKIGEGFVCNITPGFRFIAVGGLNFYEMTKKEFHESERRLKERSVPMEFDPWLSAPLRLDTRKNTMNF